MRKLWYHGVVTSMDPNMTRYEAIGAENGKIVFLGSDADGLALDWDETEDLGGNLVLPAFSDTHMHMLHYALFQQNMMLFGVPSIEELVIRAKARIAEQKPGYLLGMGWNQESLAEGRMVDKDDLDRVSTDIPVCMLRACGHIAACNTKMLDILKNLKNADPETMSYVDFQHGYLREDAMRLYMEIIPDMDDAFVKGLIRRGQRDLNACGITCTHSDDLKVLPGVDPIHLVNLFRAMEKRGELTVRVYEQCLVDQAHFPRLAEVRSSPNDHTSYFRTGPRKLLSDGSLGAESAAMIHGYVSDPDNHGILIYTDAELHAWIKSAHDDHMNVAVHAIGDLALEKVLDAVERCQKENPWPQARHGIVHAQITNPELLERMKKLHMQAYIQPIFIDADMEIIDERVGHAYAKGCYNWKTMRDMGIPTSGGSDCPVESFNIMENLYCAVTRKNKAGTKTYLPEQALTVEEGVRLFTSDAAWASGDEDWRGTLELGKLCDLAVLDRDLFGIAPEEFPGVKVVQTVMDGRTVYRR